MTTLTTFRDREGNELDLMAWAHKMEDRAYTQVIRTKTRGGIVSTIWLGMPDLNQMYETGFIGVEGEAIQIMARWVTEQEAIEGHERIVASEGGEID